MKHICSPCGLEFDSDVEYLNHECEASGFLRPDRPEHLVNTTTPNFLAVAQKAKEKGDEIIRRNEEHEGVPA